MAQSSEIRDQRSVRRLIAAAGFAVLLFTAGCRQDMQDQPKMVPQRGTEFFADHRGARPQVLNTVARGQLHEDSYFYTGVVVGANGYREEQNLMPFPVTLQVLQLQHLLHAVSFAGGQRSGRNRGTRLQAGCKSA